MIEAITGLGLLVYMGFVVCTGVINGLGWIFKACYRRGRHRHAGGPGSSSYDRR